MLRALRNKSQSFLFKIFLVLIVIGFAAWGVGDLTGNKIQPIFKSDDFEISYEQIINDFNKSRVYQHRHGLIFKLQSIMVS